VPRRAAGVPQPLERIPGIESLEYNGLDVVVSKARGGAEGPWLLLVPGGTPASQVFLRVGDSFLITDGRTFSQIYELLQAGKDQVVFRRELRQRDAQDSKATHIHGAVVAVRPYRPSNNSTSP